MDVLIKLYNFFYMTGNEPTLFGSSHIIAIILLIVSTVLIVKLLYNADDKTIRRVIFIIWCTLVAGEIYREVCFSLDVVDGRLVWDYAWYQFPFQLCSSPLYALPLIVFLPSGRLRDAFIAFMATFSLFGGLAVFAYPLDVYTDIIGSNIQSMYHHGVQIAVGILLAIKNAKKLNRQFLFDGIYVYLVFISVAMVLNIAGYNILRACSMDDTFNMFYLSPYFGCTLPLLSTIEAATSYWFVLPLYVIVFMFIAALIFYVEKYLTSRFGKVDKDENYSKDQE